MMEKMIRFSMKNVTAVMIVIALVFGVGVYAASTLKIESMPDVSFPVVFIQTQYTAPPEDVAEEVTEPLEKAVANIEDLDQMSSVSKDNYSQIILQFEHGVDLDKKKSEVDSLVSNVNLPEGAEKPQVMTFGFSSIPSYFIAAYGENGMSQAELSRIYQDVLEPAFQSLDGLDHIDVTGVYETELNIILNPHTLQSYHLTPSQVFETIRLHLSKGPAGNVEINGETQMIRVLGDLDSTFALEQMEIPLATGGTVTLKDIAVIHAVNEADFITRLDGKAAIGINLYKTSTANLVEFNEEVDRLIEGWKTTLPNVTFQPVYNAALDVKDSIGTMIREGLMGAVLASLMILYFLRNARMTLIVLVSIPLSILITLILMLQLDITLNIMTLGGMFIAVGRVVDDSIVVIENIFAQLVKRQERNESVIVFATKQVGSAITSSTLATVGVFLPMGLVSGVVGEVFRPFAITLACALMSSLLVALTVIPMLAKLLVLKSDRLAHGEVKGTVKLVERYRKILLWSLNRPKRTLLISGGLFLASILFISPFLPVAFLPDMESERTFSFELKFPNGTSTETTDSYVKDIETILSEAKDDQGNRVFNYVESIIGFGWSDEKFPNRASILVEAHEDSDPKMLRQIYTEKIQSVLPPGATVQATLLGGEDASGQTGPDFSYELKGEDVIKLRDAAAIIKAKMEEFPELSEVEDSLGDTKKEIEISVDQQKARLYGLSAMQIRQAVSSWISEMYLGDYRFDNVLYETYVKVDEQFTDSLEKIGGIMLKTPTGATVYLNEIAKVREVEAPVSIQRENEEQVVKVTAKIEGKNKAGISQKIAAELAKVPLPEGVIREVGGVSDDITESFNQLFLVMIVSVFVVYLIMVLTFGNAGAPFSILFSLPLAVIGGLLGLFVTGESLNVTSMIGFLMLIGIVVTNAIVLIDRTEQLKGQGYTVRDALVEAGTTRLRPIIMTAGATIMALFPLALGLHGGGGNLVSKSLAVVVIGGLITSTLLTLVVVPVIYEMIHNTKMKWIGIWKNKFGRKYSVPIEV